MRVEAGWQEFDYNDDDDGEVCHVKQHCSILCCRAMCLLTASDVARCWNVNSRSITVC